MTKQEKQAVFAATAETFGDEFFNLAYGVGEAARRNPRAALPIRNRAAFVKYQALMLNSEWDTEMLADAWAFLKSVVVLG